MRCPRPFVFAALVVLSACEGYNPFYIRAHIPDKVTADGLLSLKNGMTYAEVEQIVGPPLCVVEVDDKTLNESDQNMARRLVADCSGKRAASVPKNLVNATALVLSYAEPRAADPTYDPSIYAHFRGGRFSHLYVKYHDYGICCMDGLPTSPFYWIGSRDLLHKLIGR
jgi:hypothetical protein